MNAFTPLQVVAFLLVGVVGTLAVLTRDPLQQSLVLSLYGMFLAVLFLVLQAPDVGLSEIVVGAIAYPLMVMLALAKMQGGAE